MEYNDLEPYEYYPCPIPMRTIGWLGPEYGVPGAAERPLSAQDLNALQSASRHLSSIMLGTHDCEFCLGSTVFEGNGEFHYYARRGTVYSAPMMILHYVGEHGYKPPREFLDCLDADRRLDWDWRADRLVTVLRDPLADLDFRCWAITDLPNWPDPRTWAALRFAATDEMLLDCAADDIARSLHRLMPYEFAAGTPVEEFPDSIRYWLRERHRP
ncbi:DUF7919 family protein [Nocardia sp. NBC_01327]|uniref:DUF7919 family protein n=1 Tax=Nocardia sp. NBC_01327 TaxID=2903593 RepID=UPI002E158E57|nr:hypothetical protein OG326_33020 [Nocardia sp. NBC_01327]